MEIKQLIIRHSVGLVIVNAWPIIMRVEGLPDNVLSVEWLGKHGHVEYSDGSPDTELESLDDYRDIIYEHQRQVAKIVGMSPNPLTKEYKLARLHADRDARLFIVDMTALIHSVGYARKVRILSASDYRSLQDYRQKLHELPEKYSDPDEWVWPPDPECFAS